MARTPKKPSPPHPQLLLAQHMHRRVRCEARHLAATAGDPYRASCAQVPRYAPTPAQTA